MFKTITFFVQLYFLVTFLGCATVDKGAQAVGKTAGKTVDVMHTTSETAVKVIREEKQSNPYNRQFMRKRILPTLFIFSFLFLCLIIITPVHAQLTKKVQEVADKIGNAGSGTQGSTPTTAQPANSSGQTGDNQPSGTSHVPPLPDVPAMAPVPVPEGTTPIDISSGDKSDEFAPGTALGWQTDAEGNTTTLVQYPDGIVKVIKKDKDGNIIQQQRISKKDSKAILSATNDDTFDVNVLNDGTVLIDKYSSDGSVDRTTVDPPAELVKFTQTDKNSGITTTTTINDDGSKTVVRTDKDGNIVSEDHIVGDGSVTAGSATQSIGIKTTSISNPDGSRTIIKTDKNGKFISKEEIPPKGQRLASASSTDTNTGVTTTSRENPDGSRTTSTSWTKKGKDGTERTTEIDDQGNSVETVKTPDGTTTRTEKDVYGNTYEVKVEGDGSTTTTQRDVYGRETNTRESSDGTTTIVKKDMSGNVRETTEQRRDGSSTVKLDNGRTIEVGAPDDDGNFLATKTDARGNETVIVKDKDGNIIGQKEVRNTAFESGEEHYNKNAKTDRHWEDLSETEKKRYEQREREIKEAKGREELREKQDVARRKQEEEDRTWAAKQRKELEAKLAVIREEQAEADKKALQRKEEYELRTKRRDAEEKMKGLDEKIQDAYARGDKKEARRLEGEHDRVHDSTMHLFEHTEKEKKEMERKQQVRNDLVDEITGHARRLAQMETDAGIAQDLKEDITAGTKWVSIGSEMQQQTAKTTRIADREKAFAEAKQKLIEERLADPKTTAEEKKVLRDMMDLADLQKAGAERLLSDNAQITAVGYAVDAALLATGGIGNLAASVGTKAAVKVAATAAAKRAFSEAVAGGLSRGAAQRAAQAAARKATEKTLQKIAAVGESKFIEAVGKKGITELVTGKAATTAAAEGGAKTLGQKIAEHQTVTTAAAGAGVGATVDVATQLYTKGEVDLSQTAKAAFAGAASGGLVSGASRGFKAATGKGAPATGSQAASKGQGGKTPSTAGQPKPASSTPKGTAQPAAKQPTGTQVVNTPKTIPAGPPTQVVKGPGGGLPSPGAKTVLNPGRGGARTGPGGTQVVKTPKTMPAGQPTQVVKGPGGGLPSPGAKTVLNPGRGGTRTGPGSTQVLNSPKTASTPKTANPGYPKGKKPSQMTPKERQAYNDARAAEQMAANRGRKGSDGGDDILPTPKGAKPPPPEGFTKNMPQKEIDELFKGGIGRKLTPEQIMQKADIIKTGRAPQSKSNIPQPENLTPSHPLRPPPNDPYWIKKKIDQGLARQAQGGKPPVSNPAQSGAKTRVDNPASSSAGTRIDRAGGSSSTGGSRTGPGGTQVLNPSRTMPAGGRTGPGGTQVLNPGRGGTPTQVVKGQGGGLPSPGAKTVLNPGRGGARTGPGGTQVVRTPKTMPAGQPTQVVKGPGGGLPSPGAKTVLNPGRGGSRSGPGGTQVLNPSKTTLRGTPKTPQRQAYNPPKGTPKVPKAPKTTKSPQNISKQADKLAKLKKPYDAPKGKPEVPRPANGKLLKHPDKTLRRPPETEIPAKFRAEPGRGQRRADVWENMTKAERKKYVKEVEGFIKDAAKHGDRWAKRYVADMKAGKIKNYYEPRMKDNIHGLHSEGVMRLNPIDARGNLRPPAELGSVALHEGVHSGIGGKVGMNEARAHFAQMSALHRHIKRNPNYKIKDPYIKKMYDDFVNAGEGLPRNQAGFAARRNLEKTFTDGGYGNLYKDNIAKSFSKLSNYKGGNAVKAKADFRKAFNNLTKAEQQQMLQRFNGLNNQGKQNQMIKEIENFLQGAQRNAKQKLPPQYPPPPKGAPAVPTAPSAYPPQAKGTSPAGDPFRSGTGKKGADPSMTPPPRGPTKPTEMTFINEKGETVNLSRGKQIGKGKTSKTYEHPTDPKKVVKVRAHEGDFPNAPKMDKFGRDVLENKVNQNVIRVSKEFQAHTVKDVATRPASMIGKNVKVVEKIPIARNQLKKQGGKMTKGQAEAFNRATRELNDKGYSWLDNHQGNYGFEKIKGTTDQWKVVVADPGGIVPMKGRTPGAKAANARALQERINNPSKTFRENNEKFGGTPDKVAKSAAIIEREAILKEWGQHIDYRDMGLKSPNDIGFTPAGGFKNQKAQDFSKQLSMGLGLPFCYLALTGEMP